MRLLLDRLPTLVTLLLTAALLWHGPIAQPDDYHRFADAAVRFGVPNAADVLSNLGFALVSLWGFARLGRRSLRVGWAGWRLFLAGLLLTAFGSAYYHLAPDNARLLWDRLPIALLCAGLLAAVRAESRPAARCGRDALLLGLAAIASVVWWYATELHGAGDLRPYLLLQALPLILIPLWQMAAGAPRADRVAFGLALSLYIAAKLFEVEDRPLLALSGAVSGHTLKHLTATVAAAIIVARLAARPRT